MIIFIIILQFVINYFHHLFLYFIIFTFDFIILNDLLQNYPILYFSYYIDYYFYRLITVRLHQIIRI